LSEQQFADSLDKEIGNNRSLYTDGWYSPPPNGIAVLFGQPKSFDRLRFDTLRKEEYWPRSDQKLEAGSAGIIYASPVHKASGTIGDLGLTIYRGEDQTIRSHLVNCLNVMERAADLAQVGMEFRELHRLTQRLFKDAELHNARTITWTDKVGTNLGHTIPWSFEMPNPSERQIIDAGNLTSLKDVISKKRINVNNVEQFKIPENIAFTLEARLESSTDPKMPNTFYHLIIAFQNSKKSIHSNFNQIFTAARMDAYIKSKF
jgi:hypothetical protein